MGTRPWCWHHLLTTAASAWAETISAVWARLDSAVPRGPSSWEGSEGLDGTQCLPANGPGCSYCPLPLVNQGTFPSLPSPLHCPRIQITLRPELASPSVPQCCMHHPILPTHGLGDLPSHSPSCRDGRFLVLLWILSTAGVFCSPLQGRAWPQPSRCCYCSGCLSPPWSQRCLAPEMAQVTWHHQPYLCNSLPH